MNPRATTTQATSMEGLLTEALERAFEPYRKELRVGQLVRLRAAAYRAAAEAIHAFVQDRRESTLRIEGLEAEVGEDLRFLTAVLERRLEAELSL